MVQLRLAYAVTVRSVPTQQPTATISWFRVHRQSSRVSVRPESQDGGQQPELRLEGARTIGPTMHLLFSCKLALSLLQISILSARCNMYVSHSAPCLSLFCAQLLCLLLL
jgi:hypothetical protein